MKRETTAQVHDIGQLRAYLDNTLSTDERAAVAVHLAGCGACRADLAVLRERSATVAARLTALDPRPDEIPEPAQALARFHDVATSRSSGTTRRPFGQAGSSSWTTFKRSITMTKQTLLGGRWRPLTIAAAALACLLVLFSFAPARQAAADFLGIFRVRKFAVIPVDPAQARQLEGLAQMADAGRFGQPAVLREPGQRQVVTDAAEATATAGFAVRVPAVLPEGAALSSFSVETGPALHYEMDRHAMQALLDATGLQGVALPDAEVIIVDLDVPTMVTQVYKAERGRVTIIQLPSPQVAVAPELDLAALGEVAFQLVGMSPEDARRMARAIDWTSTVVIPLPTDAGRYREITVDGVTGLLLEDVDSGRRNNLLLWQRDDIVYAAQGYYVDTRLLLQMADSLR
jgi:hypothetical protein